MTDIQLTRAQRKTVQALVETMECALMTWEQEHGLTITDMSFSRHVTVGATLPELLINAMVTVVDEDDTDGD